MSRATNIRETLRVCRGCLAMDIRLYDMHQNRLMEAYTRLVQVTDDLPHYICSYCAALLLKCYTFRNKCIEIQHVFRNSEFHNIQLQQINTQFKSLYNQTDTLILDINENNDDSNDFNEPKHAIDVINNDIDSECIKHEVIINKPLNIETESECDPLSDQKNSVVIKKEKAYVANDDNDLLRYYNSSSNDVRLSKRRDKNKGAVQNTELKLDNKYVEDLQDDIDYHKNDNNCDMNAVNDNITDVDSKTTRRPKLDFEKISKEYNMEFTFLKTKEEQLKNFQELLNIRKQSDNYKLGMFKCDVCFKGFVLNEAYNKHMALHHESSSKLFCDVCNLYFNNKHSFQGHTSRHSRRFACKQCEYTTDVKESARDHFLWHGGFKYSCKLCDKKLNGRSSYYAHLKVVHPTSEELIRCEMCGDSFCGATGIKQHERMAHKEINSPGCYCSVCETQFYCSDAFKAHRGTDGVCDTTHKYCVRCGESFDTEELLKEHEIEQRKPRDEFKCEVCSKIFKNYLAYSCHREIHNSKSDLIQYRNRYYSRNKQYTVRKYKHGNKEESETKLICELCGTIYKTELGLRLHHFNIHTNVRPYECSTCKKAFKSKTSLKLHKRVHTGERPFQCEICSKAFKCCTNLSRHKRVHTGERRFSCDVCTKRFQTKGCVQMHIKTVHMKVPMPPRIRRRNKKAE